MAVPESLKNQPAPDEAGRGGGFADGDQDIRGGGSYTAVGQSSRTGQANDVAEGDVEAERSAINARYDFLDIVKAVLIILVVYAHLVEHFGTHDRVFEAVYAALSLNGLPLFVLISGMVAKPLLGDKDYRKMVAKLLLPLICLQPFYLALLARAGGDAVRHILDPQWLLWFLLSLLLWRMMLPLFLRIPMPLLVAVGITLAAGYAQYIGADLSLSRTLYFFPFFLAGYLWRDGLLRLAARARMLWGVLFIALLVGTALWFLHGLDTHLVYHDRGYDRAAVWTDYPALGQLVLLLICSVSCLAWLAMMPRKSKWLVRLGRRTLTILALHGFVVLVFLKLFTMAGWSNSPKLWLFPLLLVLSVAIAWAVSLLDGPFNRFFEWLAARLSRITPRRA
jgi:fucose 4-O-acetylase-like acetyltransferase